MSNMTPSADQRGNKRVRVDKQISTNPDSTSNITAARLKVPKARASAAIAAHTATLLPELSTILQKLGDDHLDLLHRHYNKSNQLRRLEPDITIIPRSARLEFKLSVPKSIEELPDFIALKDICQSDIDTMKLTLRGHILSALKLEVLSFVSSLKEHFTTVLHTTTAALLIAKGNNTVNAHRVVANLITAHHAELFKHIFTDIEEFKLLYTKKHALPQFPVVTIASLPNNNHLSQSSFFSQTQDLEPITPVADTLQLNSILRTIRSIFISPFESYLDQHRVNNIELELKKLVEENLTVSATAAAQLDVEMEESVSRVLLNELVQKETKKNTSKLSAEITSLKQMITSLKDQRGPNSTQGASSKRNASNQAKKKKAKDKKDKADASAQDSSKGKKQHANGKQKKATRKKKLASKTGKSK